MRGIIENPADKGPHAAPVFISQLLCRTQKRHFNCHCHLLLPRHLHNALYCCWPLLMCNHHWYVTSTSDSLFDSFEVRLRSVDEPERTPAQRDLREVASHHSPAEGYITSGINYTTTECLCQLTQQLVPLYLEQIQVQLCVCGFDRFLRRRHMPGLHCTEDVRVTRCDLTPIIRVAEADHGVAVIFHGLGLLQVAGLPVGIIVWRSVNIDSGMVILVEEVRTRLAGLHENLRAIRQAVTIGIEPVQPAPLQFGAGLAEQVFQVCSTRLWRRRRHGARACKVQEQLTH